MVIEDARVDTKVVAQNSAAACEVPVGVLSHVHGRSLQWAHRAVSLLPLRYSAARSQSCLYACPNMACLIRRGFHEDAQIALVLLCTAILQHICHNCLDIARITLHKPSKYMGWALST
jgi:hypothetical protein